MTRKFKVKVVEPGNNDEPIEIIFTEDNIKTLYFPCWITSMKKAGKEHLISFENCLEDWIVVTGADEIQLSSVEEFLNENRKSDK